MKLMIVIAFIFSQALEASSFNLEIEKKAAKLNSCSLERPCMISINKNEDRYIAKVNSFMFITEYGVLKAKAGSITYYIFDLNRKLLETRKTT